MRKKGYQQSLGFLTKYHQNNQKLQRIGNDESTSFLFGDDNDSTSHNFSLNEFFMQFAIEKFCDVATNLKRTNRTFVQNKILMSKDTHQPIFQVKGFCNRSCCKINYQIFDK